MMPSISFTSNCRCHPLHLAPRSLSALRRCCLDDAGFFGFLSRCRRRPLHLAARSLSTGKGKLTESQGGEDASGNLGETEEPGIVSTGGGKVPNVTEWQCGEDGSGKLWVKGKPRHRANSSGKVRRVCGFTCRLGQSNDKGFLRILVGRFLFVSHDFYFPAQLGGGFHHQRRSGQAAVTSLFPPAPPPRTYLDFFSP